MHTSFIRTPRDSWTSTTLSMFMLLILALGLASLARPAHASEPMIDSIVVKFRDGALVDPAGGLTDDEQAALLDEIHTPFSHVGYARDGALRLQLSAALPLDAARAAVNRLRMLPQVLYANIVDMTPVASDVAAARRAAAEQPPVTRLIVKYRDSAITAAAARGEALRPAAIERLSSLAGQPVTHERAMSGGAYVVRLFRALPLDQVRSLARYLASDETVEYVEPDLLKQPMLAPNDPSYASQWHYQSPPAEMGGVNLPPAWDLTTGSAGIVVAVIDTGILPAHPDLAGRLVAGYDFIHDSLVANDGTARDADPTDPGDWITAAESASGYFAGCQSHISTWHGTHVAGTIGAASNNGTGVAGINWVSKILPLRVLGKCGGYTSDIIDAIRWAAGISVPNVPANAFPARVMNLSLGGYACDGNGQNCGCGAASQSAINAAVAAGSVVVVSAGNERRGCHPVLAGQLQWRDHRCRHGAPGRARELQQLRFARRNLGARRRERPIRAVDAQHRHDHCQSKRLHLRWLSGHQHGGAARHRNRLADAVQKPRADTCPGSIEGPDNGARVSGR